MGNVHVEKTMTITKTKEKLDKFMRGLYLIKSKLSCVNAECYYYVKQINKLLLLFLLSRGKNMIVLAAAHIP